MPSFDDGSDHQAHALDSGCVGFTATTQAQAFTDGVSALDDTWSTNLTPGPTAES
jgi:hypothetical protein